MYAGAILIHSFRDQLTAVKKGICCPVSRHHIAGSDLQLIEVTCFFNLPVDQALVFDGSRAQVSSGPGCSEDIQLFFIPFALCSLRLLKLKQNRRPNNIKKLKSETSVSLSLRCFNTRKRWLGKHKLIGQSISSQMQRWFYSQNIHWLIYN